MSTRTHNENQKRDEPHILIFMKKIKDFLD
jgi:hypothetical protein